MRLGRLAVAGLTVGALVAFAVALLLPRRRPAHPDAQFPPTTDVPDVADVTGVASVPPGDRAAAGLQIDVADAEKARMITVKPR